MPTGQEVEGSKLHPLSLVSIVVGIAVIVIVAIFFRPGAFSVVAEGQGASIKLNLADSRVDLSELLDKLLQKAGSVPTPSRSGVWC
jgi:hypothetical protein